MESDLTVENLKVMKGNILVFNFHVETFVVIFEMYRLFLAIELCLHWYRLVYLTTRDLIFLLPAFRFVGVVFDYYTALWIRMVVL